MSIHRVAAAGFVLTCIVVSAGGCPGVIDDPAPFLAFEGTGGSSCNAPADIFLKSCGVSLCHNITDMKDAGDLDLASPGVEARVNGKPASDCDGLLLADPSNPEQSALYLKVTPQFCGDSRMPIGPFLDADQQQCIRDWIASLPGGMTTSSTTSGGGMGGAGGMSGAGGAGGSGGMASGGQGGM